MASAADAAIVGLSVDGVNVSDGTEDIPQNTVIELSIVSDTDDHPWLMEISVLKADATLILLDDVIRPAAGSLASYIPFPDGTWWIYEISTAGAPGTIKAGQQWVFDLSTSLSIGSVFTVYLGEYGKPPVSTIDFTVVPEPVTIALLGLGGLLVLRRRK
jgi:hypothetical protein